MTGHKKVVRDPEVELWPGAAEALIEIEPKLEPVIRRVGSPKLTIINDQFEAITLSILRQQVNSKLADGIVEAVATPYGGFLPSAKEIVAAGKDSLRVKGLTRQRVDYVWDFANQVVQGDERAMNAINAAALPDDAAGAALRGVRGVGAWSAAMILICGHARGDVLVPGDANLKGALHRLLGMPAKASDEAVERRSRKWRPHRSAALWYLWHSGENIHPGLA